MEGSTKAIRPIETQRAKFLNLDNILIKGPNARVAERKREKNELFKHIFHRPGLRHV